MEDLNSTAPVENGEQQSPAVEESLLTAGIEQGEAAPENEPSSLLTEGEKDEQKPAEEKPTEGVPENYEFKLQEGFTLPKDVAEEIAPILKGMKLSQEQAQQLADAHMSIVKKERKAAEEFKTQLVQGWRDELKNDPDFGGANFDKNSGYARRALKFMQSSDPKEAAELKDFLDHSGFGNAPPVIKAFARLGKRLAEDGILGGGEASGVKKETGPDDWFSKTLSELKD